ncbi:hypothetical protein ACWGE0_31195 [Lentzea sp. NPDC054927]
MTQIVRDRHAALLGFAASATLLTATVVTFLQDSLAFLGWQGGEYAYAFIWITIGLIVAGAVLRATAPSPWRSIGSGMAWAGAIGVLVVIVLIILFIVAFSNWNP